jgi:hypothetical protein
MELAGANDLVSHGPALKFYINTLPTPILFIFFFFSSPALFAFWLRSSVVSVLFSLISESVLRNTTLINLIFASSDGVSVLAHAPLHCVLGLTLPSSDANTLFSSSPSAGPPGWRRKGAFRTLFS